MYKCKCFELYSNLAAVLWCMVLPGHNGKKTRSQFPAIILLQCKKEFVYRHFFRAAINLEISYDSYLMAGGRWL